MWQRKTAGNSIFIFFFADNAFCGLTLHNVLHHTTITEVLRRCTGRLAVGLPAPRPESLATRCASSSSVGTWLDWPRSLETRCASSSSVGTWLDWPRSLETRCSSSLWVGTAADSTTRSSITTKERHSGQQQRSTLCLTAVTVCLTVVTVCVTGEQVLYILRVTCPVDKSILSYF